MAEISLVPPNSEKTADMISVGLKLHGENEELPKNMYCKYVLPPRSEEHTSELQSLTNLVCRLLLEKKKKQNKKKQKKKKKRKTRKKERKKESMKSAET